MKKSEGFYYNGVWSKEQSGDPGNMHDLLLSAHEFAHSILDAGSVYGQVIKLYTTLSQFSIKHQKKFTVLLSNLRDYNRELQEVYATWFSYTTTLQEYTSENEMFEALKASPEEMKYYFRMGVFVNNIPNIRLRLLCMFSVAYYCCSANVFKPEYFYKPEKFLCNSIRYYFYPDGRFELLEQYINSNFILDVLLRYINEADDVELREFVRIALYSEKDPEIFKNLSFTIKLQNSLTDFICKQLDFLLPDTWGGYQNINAHLEFLTELKTQLSDKYGIDEFLTIHPLFESVDSLMIMKQTLISFENEILLISENDVPTIIHPLISYAHEFWYMIEAEINFIDSVNIIIMARTRVSLMLQHNIDDASWQKNLGDTKAILYYSVRKKDKIDLFPIGNLSVFKEIRDLTPQGYSVYIFPGVNFFPVSPFGNDLHNYMQENFFNTFYLNDFSLLGLIHGEIDNREKISYWYWEYVMSNNTNYCMIIEVSRYARLQKEIFIVPCTNFYGLIICDYIKDNFKTWKEENALIHRYMVPAVEMLKKVFSELKQWDFANSGVEDLLFYEN